VLTGVTEAFTLEGYVLTSLSSPCIYLLGNI